MATAYHWILHYRSLEGMDSFFANVAGVGSEAGFADTGTLVVEDPKHPLGIGDSGRDRCHSAECAVLEGVCKAFGAGLGVVEI